MRRYEYGRIHTLARSLEKAEIAQELIDQIMEGGEGIRRSTSSEKKAEWMKEAMLRMDNLLDKETRHSVREACACCVGGKRLKIAKGISRENEKLEDRIKSANEARYVFGHSVTMMEDGRILVCFEPEGLTEYRCVCLPKAKEPLSITYCYCCGGHVKHHLQIALDRKLACRVRSSALSSGGRKPCTFIFSIKE